MAETYTGPLPKPTPETQPFWDAAKQRRLLIQACDDCGVRYFYPRPLCPACLSRRVRWLDASGRARLHTFVINHRPPRNFPVPPPYVLGIVELEEGPRLLSHIVGVAADPAALRCDMPLEVVFEELTPDITLPKFRTAGRPMTADYRKLRGSAAIVGVGESDELGRLPHKSSLQLHMEAAHSALADAGLGARDVDAVFTSGRNTANDVPEYLGIRPRFVGGTQVGGCSFILHVEHAMAAIHAGLCEVALITHGESGYSRIAMPAPRWGDDSVNTQFELVHGTAGPPTAYGFLATRHMHEYGTTKEQMAEVAVATRAWAALNPKAFARDPIGIADVLGSRMISWPFNLLDCCLVTDAGGACVVTSSERARDLRRPPVYVLGTGECVTHQMVSQMPSFSRWDAAVASGERAFRMAGLRHAEIDVAQFYDAFTIVPILALEALGFCRPGEGGPFVAGQRTAPGGAFPMNTNGGGLSYTHTGMYGIFTIIEAVRQLRGECGSRQVLGAKAAICHGAGGVWSAAATMIVATET